MPTRKFTRAANRLAIFAAALSLFCALNFISSGASTKPKSTETRTQTQAAFVSARGVAVAVSDYTVTTTGNAIVVTDVSGNGDTLIVAEPASGQIKFVAAGRTFSVDGGAPISGDSGNVSLSGINSITINQGNGNDTLSMQPFTFALPSLTINGDAGDDMVNFNGSINFAANANLDVNLQDDSATPGADSAFVASGVELKATGTGSINLRVSKTIIMGGLLQTQNGDITVEANRQATPTSGMFIGVGMSGGTIKTTGTGSISVKGTGGAGDFAVNIGVQFLSGTQVTAIGTGTISIDGVGGAGSGGPTAGSENTGVEIANLGTIVGTASGAIQVTGQGGTTNDTGSYGVVVDGGKVQTAGAGTLTITGNGGVVTGGSSTFVNSAGVFIIADDNGDGGIVTSTGTGVNAGAIVVNGIAADGGAGSAQGIRVDAPGTITSVDGSITLDGAGGPCGNACLGTSIRGAVTATGSGNILIAGTGASTTGVFPTHGVNVRSGGSVTTNNGDISITGTGGNGTDNAGFNLAPNGTGTLQTTGTGNVSVSADTIKLHTANATVNAGTRAVTLTQKSEGAAIDLGSTSDSTANTVELSDAELDRITAATLNIGNATSGAITVSANITRAAATNINLTSGASIDISGGSLDSAGGNVSLAPGTNTFPSLAGVDVNAGAAGTLTLASAKDLKIVVDGTTVDTGYTQLNVAGKVNLNGASLSVSGSHTPALGQTFVIVNNDGADAITGTFNGLPEGGVINFLNSGLGAQITYTGGTGNDAVLTVVNVPSLSISDISHLEGNNGDATPFVFTVTKTGAGAASVNFSTTDGTATTSDSDYTGDSGTLNFASSDTEKQFTIFVNGDGIPELDEDFGVVLSDPMGANIANGKATATIVNDDESANAGQFIISEFRLRGPGAAPVGDRPTGGPVLAAPARDKNTPQTPVSTSRPVNIDTSPPANDEFVELYNNTNQDILVTTTDGSDGWTVVASGGNDLFFIPNGTVIPARAHYLGTNVLGYSLNNVATGDTTWIGVEVPDNAGIAVFRTNDPAHYNMSTRLDAVGSTAEPDTLYKEGAGYPALAPADISLNLEHSFYRSLCSFVDGVGCATLGFPKDSGDNASDFVFVDTQATPTAAGQHLGSPGPENLSSPRQRNNEFGFFLLDATKTNADPPNRERSFTPGDQNTSPQGKLTIRRRVTNNTGAPIIALRFRVIEVTTNPNQPGVADLRVISGEETESVEGILDPDTCNGAVPCTVPVEPTTLEQPPLQPKGGGFNSTVAAGTVSLDTPLEDGESVNLQFTLGVVHGGAFRIYFNIEAVDDAPVPERPPAKPKSGVQSARTHR